MAFLFPSRNGLGRLGTTGLPPCRASIPTSVHLLTSSSEWGRALAFAPAPTYQPINQPSALSDRAAGAGAGAGGARAGVGTSYILSYWCCCCCGRRRRRRATGDKWCLSRPLNSAGRSRLFGGACPLFARASRRFPFDWATGHPGEKSPVMAGRRCGLRTSPKKQTRRARRLLLMPLASILSRLSRSTRTGRARGMGIRVGRGERESVCEERREIPE